MLVACLVAPHPLLASGPKSTNTARGEGWHNQRMENPKKRAHGMPWISVDMG